jgi:hypothetical protein
MHGHMNVKLKLYLFSTIRLPDMHKDKFTLTVPLPLIC